MPDRANIFAWGTNTISIGNIPPGGREHSHEFLRGDNGVLLNGYRLQNRAPDAEKHRRIIINIGIETPLPILARAERMKGIRRFTKNHAMTEADCLLDTGRSESLLDGTIGFGLHLRFAPRFTPRLHQGLLCRKEKVKLFLAEKSERRFAFYVNTYVWFPVERSPDGIGYRYARIPERIRERYEHANCVGYLGMCGRECPPDGKGKTAGEESGVLQYLMICITPSFVHVFEHK